MEVSYHWLADALEEMRRAYAIVRDVRTLIDLSRVEEPLRTEEWAEKRKKLQDKIEGVCEKPLDEKYVQLGDKLRILVANHNESLKAVNK